MTHAFANQPQASATQLPCHVMQVDASKSHSLTMKHQHSHATKTTPLVLSIDQPSPAHDGIHGEQSHHQCALACHLNHLAESHAYNIDKLDFSLATQSDSLKDNTPRQAFLRQLDRPPQNYI